MRSLLIASCMVLPALGLLGGCQEPFDATGTWNPAQVNQLNVAAQAADWHDLAYGHGDPGADGQEAAAAVDRLRKGTVKSLAAATVSDVASQSAGGGSSSPAAPN